METKALYLQSQVSVFMAKLIDNEIGFSRQQNGIARIIVLVIKIAFAKRLY